jgi:hypothetical protein
MLVVDLLFNDKKMRALFYIAVILGGALKIEDVLRGCLLFLCTLSYVFCEQENQP